MPNTCHRDCLWHILDKLPSNLGGVSIHNEGLVEKIKSCVHKSDTPLEFRVLGIKSCQMLPLWTMIGWKLYSTSVIRDPAYLKENFFASMSTAQRSESMNSFVKQYVE